jgi:hypothetical protein
MMHHLPLGKRYRRRGLRRRDRDAQGRGAGCHPHAIPAADDIDGPVPSRAHPVMPALSGAHPRSCRPHPASHPASCRPHPARHPASCRPHPARHPASCRPHPARHPASCRPYPARHPASCRPYPALTPPVMPAPPPRHAGEGRYPRLPFPLPSPAWRARQHTR